jgi:hypothetical protein
MDKSCSKTLHSGYFDYRGVSGEKQAVKTALRIGASVRLRISDTINLKLRLRRKNQLEVYYLNPKHRRGVCAVPQGFAR